MPFYVISFSFQQSRQNLADPSFFWEIGKCQQTLQLWFIFSSSGDTRAFKISFWLFKCETELLRFSVICFSHSIVSSAIMMLRDVSYFLCDSLFAPLHTFRLIYLDEIPFDSFCLKSLGFRSRMALALVHPTVRSPVPKILLCFCHWHCLNGIGHLTAKTIFLS